MLFLLFLLVERGVKAPTLFLSVLKCTFDIGFQHIVADFGYWCRRKRVRTAA